MRAFARLVSSNRESFAYTNSNTILLLYAGDIRVPPRVPASGPEPCGGNKEMKGDVQYCYFFSEVFLYNPVSKTRNK